jgi:pentatricopeptide repeat protein
MNTRISAHRALALVAGAAAVWLAGRAPARADAAGTIIAKDNKQYPGNIRWQGGMRAYAVEAKGMTMTLPLDRVRSIDVPASPALATAIRNVQEGRYTTAIPALKDLISQYEMLGPDVTAAGWLMNAYRKTNEAKKAVEIFEKMMRNNVWAPMSGDFVQQGAEAMLTSGQYDKLDVVLKDIIKRGSRVSAAWAQIKRGDILMKKGNFRDALEGGFLRTCMLYRDIRTAQPESLFKAAECFDQLGQGPYAERMRKKLLEDFPDSEYAKLLKSGGKS